MMTFRHKTNRLALFLLCSSVAALTMPVAVAQPADDKAEPAADAPDPEPQAGEVTVTARYRKESAQKVPIAITALAADTLDRQGVFNIKQVVQQLPSLNIQGISGRNQTITIRGLGTNAGGTNDGLEQGVGIYVDGIYRPRTGSVITDLIDIESIQLLRGPQGTLFGKNTVAGAIDIRTREPSFEPEARAELTYGNYDYVRGYLALGAPITDDLAFRVSYLRTRRDGIIRNTTYDEDWDQLDNHAARLDVVWKPRDDFKLRVIADYSIQTGDMGFQSVAEVLPTTLANGTEVRGFYRRAADVGYVPIPVRPFDRKTDIDSSQYDEMPSWGISVRGDWTTPGGTTVTSLSAFRRWQWIPNYDGDQFGANILTQSIVDTDQRQFSTELRAASPGDQVIDWTGGLYFFWQEADDLSVTGYGRDAAGWLTTPNTAAPDAVAALPPAALDGLFAYAHVVPRTHSYAAYGQATWNVSPAFRLTAGLRFTYEHKTGLYDAYAGGDVAPIGSFPLELQAAVAARRAALTPAGSYTARRDTNNLSWNLNAAYDLSADVHAYATYSRGYKSPGINLVAPSRGVDVFVNPEKVDNFELGLKSRFLDGRAELNLAAFWTEDSDYQANFINTNVTPVVGYIANVGKLRSRGVELDARLAPVDGLTLTAAGAYTDARYVTYRNAPAPYLTGYLGVVDLSGRRASGSPEWSLTGSAEYVHRGTAVEAYIGGDASYRSAYFAAVNLDPYSEVPGYAIAGLHAGVRAPDGRWDVTAWVRNLTDTDFYNTRAVNSTYGIVLAALGEPRTFGLTLRGRL